MTELRNIQADLSRFRLRVLIIAIVVVIAFGLVAARLVWLQVLRHDDLAEQAESNRTAVVPIVPNRGQILDRNGVVLATNYSAYTWRSRPRAADLEQTIEALSKVVDIQPTRPAPLQKLQEESKSFESLPIRTRLTDEEVARFAAHRFQFPGVEIKARLFRTYPFGELASHVIGYIGRINQAEKERIQESDDAANYRGTDYISKLGVEQSYEAQLHGTTGVEEIETSAGGQAVRQLAVPRPRRQHGGAVDRHQAAETRRRPVRRPARRPGRARPQDRRGAGLCQQANLRSQPVCRRHRPGELAELNESIDKPLLNRALRGTYRRIHLQAVQPMALAALETGKRTRSRPSRTPATTMFGKPPVPRRQGRRHMARWTCTSPSCSRDTYYDTCWPTTWAWT